MVEHYGAESLTLFNPGELSFYMNNFIAIVPIVLSLTTMVRLRELYADARAAADGEGKTLRRVMLRLGLRSSYVLQCPNRLVQ